MRTLNWRAVMVGTLCFGCSRAVPVVTSTSAVPISTVTTLCPLASSDTQLTGWRQVQATGFVFCVPPDWHAEPGARVWKSGGASIEWATGDYKPKVIRVVTTVTERKVDPTRPPPEPMLSPNDYSRRFTEKMDGRSVQLWYNKMDGTYYTGAVWRSPAFSLSGQSKEEDAAGIEMRIYRTVRVESETPPGRQLRDTNVTPP